MTVPDKTRTVINQNDRSINKNDRSMLVPKSSVPSQVSKVRVGVYMGQVLFGLGKS